MSDIVKRLTKGTCGQGCGTMTECICATAEEAADEITRLRERIDNAQQAAAETQPSWKHRCYAILNALGIDCGDPEWMMPDERRKLKAEVKQLTAALWVAGRRFELLAAHDDTPRNGVQPSVGAAEVRAALTGATEKSND